MVSENWRRQLDPHVIPGRQVLRDDRAVRELKAFDFRESNYVDFPSGVAAPRRKRYPPS